MNEQFLNRMQTMIPDEFEAFMASLDQDLYKALRINTKKVDPDRFPEPGLLGKPSPFADHSWYVDRPLGLDPYHICGLFYLQEPSASGVVGLLDVQKDDFVLDLCAAPGSKTTQIAQKLESGMLVCNEIDAKRAQALLSNLERMGVVNFALTNSESGPLCAAFENCFDKVLVDAPCSGEGMLKKHAIVAQTWSMDNIFDVRGAAKGNRFQRGARLEGRRGARVFDVHLRERGKRGSRGVDPGAVSGDGACGLRRGVWPARA